MGDIELSHAFQQIYKRKHIVFKIHQWLFNRFAHCFISCEMNDAGDIGVLLKDGKRVIKIAQVDLIIFYLFAVV